jgi:hypothetical protein
MSSEKRSSVLSRGTSREKAAPVRSPAPLRSVNRHHLWWPSSRYSTPLEKEFRELPCNVFELQVEIHQLIHYLSEPPEKPLIRDMLKAIRNHQAGRCPCRRDPLNKKRRG